jgi:hypothetical protein
MALLMVSTISHVLTAGDGKMDLMNDGVNLMDPQPNVESACKPESILET